VGGWEDDGRTYVYRDRNWTFVERPGDRPDELYDRRSDLGERENVLDEHPERVRTCRERLDRHRETVRATDTEVERVETDAATERRLRRLGYHE
jgi:arylsulfatase A-like enzyme